MNSQNTLLNNLQKKILSILYLLLLNIFINENNSFVFGYVPVQDEPITPVTLPPSEPEPENNGNGGSIRYKETLKYTGIAVGVLFILLIICIANRRSNN